MQEIAVVTATRAEYGLLRPVVRALRASGAFRVSLLVTGAHLSEAYGETVREIERDDMPIAARIPILSGDDTPRGVSGTMANALNGFAAYFEAHRPDALLVLGDRYEILAVCCAAMNARIPIFHLHGGETTQGAVDEAIRHSITKMSLLHFTSNEQHRRRVIQLGEQPDRVFNVGAPGVENALHVPLLSKEALAESVGLPLQKPYAVVTFHPVTLEDEPPERQLFELFAAMDAFDLEYIITKANADAGGLAINRAVDDYAAKRDNVAAFDSLGLVRYLSAVKYCAFVAGNSSSGILEAPSFGVPTVNIGDRQKGRMQAESVLQCAPARADIARAFAQALTPAFQNKAAHAVNPYGDGDTSGKIVAILQRVFSGPLDLKKTFYDIDFTV
ncbi:MAG TPA: UDP-N-acetylglucosamine 2-epimerase (hydrolyzing) [Candidatus Fimenecus excrementigallinarum]|uniref:UDP-N-acetylglucosamine 2-epimerase (Hydrolyzing) n=1 Tax=Candidatus Fimenecus excrementigallinarum TaxID=2840816 RepID=A0A9D1IH08_9FIRM|nr:UDP-N-acetylglucosamine 2-epimerase (hydrolyzing) [Candidatus Fimenecus excrementigallinarum]